MNKKYFKIDSLSTEEVWMLKGLFLLEQHRFYSTDLQPNILSHSNQSNICVSNVSNLYVQSLFDNEIWNFKDSRIDDQQP